MNETKQSSHGGETLYECICSTDMVYTILSILGFIVPLLISEILPLSNCEANGIIDGIIKLSKNRRQLKK
jgi:hypothetical protein